MTVAVPKRITPRWIVTRAPHLSRSEIDALAHELKKREWDNEAGLRAILRAIPRR